MINTYIKIKDEISYTDERSILAGITVELLSEEEHDVFVADPKCKGRGIWISKDDIESEIDNPSSFEDILKNYSEARGAIGEFFDDAPMWYDLIDHTDEVWTDYGEEHDSIGFDLEDDEFQYSFEVYGTSRWEKEGYVLFVGNDGCGNRDLYLFKTANKDEPDIIEG